MAMSKLHPNAPMPTPPAPERGDGELCSLLSEPLAQALRQAPEGAAALRRQLLGRLAASRAAEACMFTARWRRLPRQPLAAGITAQVLYRAQAGAVLRPGEPLYVRLIELAPGASLMPNVCGTANLHREWLVLTGSVMLGPQTLSQRDYHVTPVGYPSPAIASPEGGVLFLRESALAAEPGEAPFTVRDGEAGWPDFAPGIKRRVLWQRGGQAALLYYAQPGAQVPQHVHGHDEECLMVQGELFLDDLLLQAGDYQLAPAGSGHHTTHTDTGVVIYAHGDLDLQFTG